MNSTEHRSVGTPSTRLFGLLAIACMTWVVVGGLFFTPADINQGESVRIMYVHVPTAWVAYLAFIVTGVASALYMLRWCTGLLALAAPNGMFGWRVCECTC